MKGVTIVELLIATLVFVIAITAVLSIFTGSIISDELNRNTMLAYMAIQSKMEEIKNQAFDTLIDFNGQVFDLSGFPAGEGKGKVTVTSIDANRAGITILGCFKSRNRTIGNNINNCTVSPVKLVTQITR